MGERSFEAQSAGEAQFYLTAPAPCPYVPGRTERKVFTHLEGRAAGALNHALTQVGFRRSQNIAYRPACEHCRACVSVRVVVEEFIPSRSMRRVMVGNEDLTSQVRPAQATFEQYALFRRYLDARHGDGGMAGMSPLEYGQMIDGSMDDTHIVEYRLPQDPEVPPGEGPLAAAALTDILDDGLSMVYSFFDIGLAERGLGTYMILDHIARARLHGLPYVYLGYWVEGSPKMDYKQRFCPQERLIGRAWRRYGG